MFKINHFKNLSNITHGITQRGGVGEQYGFFNLATHVNDDESKVIQNRKILAKEIGCEFDHLIFANQTHSTNVAMVDVIDDTTIDNTDAMITNTKGVCLNVLTADCVPILLYDPVKQAVGVVHAGWKGTAGNIIEKTIMAMSQNFQTKSEHLLVGIGPCISKTVYEVGEEVAIQFSPECLCKKENGKFNLDLVQSNINQLEAIGVLKRNIEIMRICTFQSLDFYSARKEGLESGRFSSFVMLN